MHQSEVFSLEYVPKELIDPSFGKTIIYQPLIDLLIIGDNRKITRPVGCLVDTGADLNLFPADIARVYLGMSQKKLEKGRFKEFGGIGNISQSAYGHKVTLKHSNFNLRTWVYFLEEQSLPLLGRNGFMDKFKKIEFDEENKKLIIHT